MEKYLRGWRAQTLYALEYEHGGTKWALNFYAVDDEDAQAKVESLKKSLIILGRSEGFIPVNLHNDFPAPPFVGASNPAMQSPAIRIDG